MIKSIFQNSNLLAWFKNRDIMNSHFHDLKNQMKSIQDTMRRKLTKLTIDSDEAIRVLKEKSEKVSHITILYKLNKIKLK